MGGRGASVYPTGKQDEVVGTRKSTPKSISSAMKLTNPQWNGFNTPTGYSTNCQRSVVAYELLRRGYNVTAKPRPQNGEVLTPSNWRNAFVGIKINHPDPSTASNQLQSIKDTMAKFGDGARAVLYWMHKQGFYAHVIVAEQHNGKTLFIDPQRNVRLKESDLKEDLKSADRLRTTLHRTDNLEIDSKRIGIYVERGKNNAK